MSWFSFIPNLFKSGKEVAEVFVENKENKGERSHLEVLSDMGLTSSTLEQFAAEFHARSNRSWWDSFVDGLNSTASTIVNSVCYWFFYNGTN